MAARKQRWLDLYAGDTRFVYWIAHDPGAPPQPKPWPSLRQERIEWAWEAYCRHAERTEWLHDDSLPCLQVFTGTEIFAEAFGCAVHRPEDNMPFALPLVSSASEAARLKVPELSTSSLAYLFDIADELRRRAGDEALVRLVDVQSPMDIVALIWDKTDLYPALIETPEAVRELAHKVGRLLTAFADEWFARYGREFIAHYPAYYMPFGFTLSEDEVGAVGTDVSEEFFLPELVMLSERYVALGMHCCADARHHWEGFLRIPNLRVLNLVQPRKVVRDAYAFFAPHTAQLHPNFSDGPAWTWPEELPAAARVIFDVWAETRDQALELSDRLREVSR